MARSLALSAFCLLALGTAAAPAQQPPAAPAAPVTAPQPEGGPDITVSGQARPIDPLDGPAVFLSPMGEPFRSDDKLSGAEHWYVQADTDHDRRLTRVEFQADAARFFARLDTVHDGVIGPDELLHYETEIAPEVMVLSTYGDVSKMKVDSDGKVSDPPYPTRLGAGRYSWIITPEPVIAADSNMDRGVTKLEFEAAANARFKILDRNGDGALVRAELPKLVAPRGGQ
jgi:hypothetical protein